MLSHFSISLIESICACLHPFRRNRRAGDGKPMSFIFCLVRGTCGSLIRSNSAGKARRDELRRYAGSMCISPRTALLPPQCDQRIDSTCSASRDVTCCYRDGEHQCGSSRIDQGIGRANVENQARQRPALSFWATGEGRAGLPVAVTIGGLRPRCRTRGRFCRACFR